MRSFPLGIPVVAGRSVAEFLGGKLLCVVAKGWEGWNYFLV